MTVLAAPITHTPPRDPRDAVELPALVKSRLRLDATRSWIITTEVNIFTWPGPDIRPIDQESEDQSFAYGYLPSRLTRTMLESVRDHMRQGLAKFVQRDKSGRT